MNNPLLTTKLAIPRLPHRLVARPYLTERLDQSNLGGLTLLSAPPGFGKTTLLCHWLSRQDTPVAWLSLEEDDNEPVRFFSYLVGALGRVEAGLGSAALTLLQSAQPAPPEQAMAVLVNDLDATPAP